jgi:hypothetical protein
MPDTPTAAELRAWIAERLGDAGAEMTAFGVALASGRLLAIDVPLDELDGQVVARFDRWRDTPNPPAAKPYAAGRGWRPTTRGQRQAAVRLAHTATPPHRVLVAYPKGPQPNHEGEDDGRA